ncbi:MAG: hypothetical protein MPJ06_01250 [Nitrosopumilus sp.]|nr:hypothetical protein [Nitrosopumilus sp.]MDA7942622.1 hypothetical protein [Nitrosopumilus sp.]
MAASTRGDPGAPGLPSPVHVSVEDGDECIIYKESEMAYGRPYVVEWMGGPVALVRTRGGVDILEPDPDAGPRRPTC